MSNELLRTTYPRADKAQTQSFRINKQRFGINNHGFTADMSAIAVAVGAPGPADIPAPPLPMRLWNVKNCPTVAGKQDAGTAAEARSASTTAEKTIALCAEAACMESAKNVAPRVAVKSSVHTIG